MSKILNIAAGKLFPLSDVMPENKNTFLVQLDRMYSFSSNSVELECESDKFDSCYNNMNQIYYMNSDAIEFMELCRVTFDIITIYRYLEHIPFTNVLYFIYLLSTSLRDGGLVDIIVPDYKILAQKLLNEDVDNSNFERDNILITTEMLNEPGCPHASIWTSDRLKKFFELEGRFKTTMVKENFNFDGRDIYIRYQAVKF